MKTFEKGNHKDGGPTQAFRDFDNGLISGVELYERLNQVKSPNIFEYIWLDLLRSVSIIQDYFRLGRHSRRSSGGPPANSQLDADPENRSAKI